MENVSSYIAIIAILISAASLVRLIYTRARTTKYKALFKKKQNGEALNKEETELFRKLQAMYIHEGDTRNK